MPVETGVLVRALLMLEFKAGMDDAELFLQPVLDDLLDDDTDDD